MKKSFLLFLFIGLFSVKAQNSREHISSYNQTTLTYKFSKQWMAYTEFQTRSIEDYSYIDYYEIKGGVGYNFNSDNQALIGIGRYATYKEHSISNEELRLWLQYTFSHYIGRLDLDHRVRAEQRFFHMPQTDTNSNTQRFRYRLSATYPLNNEKVKAKTFFLNAFEEIFMGPNDNFIKRNRLFSGFGYQFTNYMTVSTGYLWQRELANSGNRNLHFLYFALNFTIDKSKGTPTKTIIPVAD